MKTFLLTVFIAMLRMNSYAQNTASLALPAEATDISTIPPVVTPGYMVQITEGGTIPSNPGFTCDGKAHNFKSIAAYTVAHYFDGGKETLKQTMQAFKMVGGFVNEIRNDYDNINASGTAGFISKTPLIPDGNTVYYTVTKKCAGQENTTSTALFYFVRIADDSNFGTIQINIYDGTIDQAKKYADEIIRRLKTIDYAGIK
jgi:hypothetical protein